MMIMFFPFNIYPIREIIYKLNKILIKASIIYRKGAIHRPEIERPFLAAKSFDAKVEQFLPLYHVLISNAQVPFFTCTFSHMHGCEPKQFGVHEIFCTKNYNL